MPNVVRLLAFAGARDVIGAAEVDVSLEERCTVAEFFERICERFPALVPYRGSLRLAVNGSYASNKDYVTAGDEVAIIPPVAGG